MPEVDEDQFIAEHGQIGDMGGAAWFSKDHQYRYLLTRWWGPGLDPLVVIGLNPSTATATVNDPTITRCINFAKREGYDGLNMFNLFAYRATDPKELTTVLALDDPGNLENLPWLLEQCDRFPQILCAWGNTHTKWSNVQIAATTTMLSLTQRFPDKLYCLGTTKDGNPRHPLYLKADTPLEPWKMSIAFEKKRTDQCNV